MAYGYSIFNNKSAPAPCCLPWRLCLVYPRKPLNPIHSTYAPFYPQPRRSVHAVPFHMPCDKPKPPSEAIQPNPSPDLSILCSDVSKRRRDSSPAPTPASTKAPRRGPWWALCSALSPASSSSSGLSTHASTSTRRGASALMKRKQSYGGGLAPLALRVGLPRVMPLPEAVQEVR